jgi:S-adenosylmethionine:tRNA ribosyltransferase-isomerase
MQAIHELGETPLPDEIRFKRAATEDDRDRFQTIYAEHVGAVAAPTAGLHFSKIVMKRMELNGAQFTPITLHVGLGTFRQVDVEDLTKHKTDSEHFMIDDSTCKFVNEAIDNKKQVLAVGTTVMKALESSVSASGHLKPINSWTDKFIFPPYEFKIPTALLTNFHLPESILLMMASAFGGHELITEAYKQAIKEKYRFFSYGDVMLII